MVSHNVDRQASSILLSLNHELLAVLDIDSFAGRGDSLAGEVIDDVFLISCSDNTLYACRLRTCKFNLLQTETMTLHGNTFRDNYVINILAERQFAHTVIAILKAMNV